MNNTVEFHSGSRVVRDSIQPAKCPERFWAAQLCYGSEPMVWFYFEHLEYHGYLGVAAHPFAPGTCVDVYADYRWRKSFTLVADNSFFPDEVFDSTDPSSIQHWMQKARSCAIRHLRERRSTLETHLYHLHLLSGEQGKGSPEPQKVQKAFLVERYLGGRMPF